MDNFPYQPFLPPPSATATPSPLSMAGGPHSSSSFQQEDHMPREDRKRNRRRGAGVKLSTDPQSVAARERRHRISDRFKILQSLVPGGSKMDTVSMLEEAIHYVKFLKAQIWLHQALMTNSEESSPPPPPSAPPMVLPPPSFVSFPNSSLDNGYGAVAAAPSLFLPHDDQQYHQQSFDSYSLPPFPLSQDCWSFQPENEMLYSSRPSSIDYYQP